jgi:CelD/BcsL family acetyltransferase involved in cellulose biosynthesis
MADSKYQVTLIQTEAQLWELGPEWRRLSLQCAPNVFTSFEWIWSWWLKFGKGEAERGLRRLHIVAARERDRLAAIIPLVIRNSAHAGALTRILEFPDILFADYMDPIVGVDGAGALIAIFEYLARLRSWDLLLLRRIRPSARLVDALDNALQSSSLEYRRREDETYLRLPIQTSWEGMLQSRSPSSRAAYRVKANRLAKSAQLRVRVLPTIAGDPSLIDRILAVESKKQLAGKPAPATLGLNPDCEAFFRHLICGLNAGDWLYAAVMEDEQRLVAYELGFRSDMELWSYTKSYDPAYAYYSPGTMLAAAVIDYGFQNGFRAYDTLRGLEEFKRRLGGMPRASVRFDIWRATFRSRLAAKAYLGPRATLYRWSMLLRGRDPVCAY